MSNASLPLPYSLGATDAAEVYEKEMAERCESAALAGFRRGLICALGEVRADLVIADLTSKTGESNATLAAEIGVTRAALSKMFIRCRRNLGFQPLRVPGNRRPGAKNKKGAA